MARNTVVDGFPVSGFDEDFHSFVSEALTAATPAELTLRYRDGTSELMVAEVGIYIDAYTPGTGAKIELHWADSAGDVDSTEASTTRLAEFIYDIQNVVLIKYKASKKKFFIVSSETGTYHINVRYLYS